MNMKKRIQSNPVKILNVLMNQNLKRSDEESNPSKFLFSPFKQAPDSQTYLCSNNEENKEEDEITEEYKDEDIYTTPAIKKNPFLYYGFGVKLYFELIQTLIIVMALITILLIPVYII